jgi:hypothetical protein
LKKFLFADLDDTLFQTIAKCAASDALEPAAYYRTAASARTPRPPSARLVRHAGCGMTLIPTTARDRDAFAASTWFFNSYAVSTTAA